MPLQANLFGMTVEDRSIELLRMYEPPEGYFLAFSGGKDSCVLLELARRSGVKYDAHYSVTGIDPPELVRFIREHHPEVAFERPRENWWNGIMAHGLPIIFRRWYCRSLKEGHGYERVVLTGIRAAESSRRAKRTVAHPCSRGHGRDFVNPILFWTDDDVWGFIRGEKLPYCCLYDDGWKRLGCVICPFESPKNTQRSLARWPRLFAATEKRARMYWEKRLGDGGTGPEHWFETFEDWWDWWLRRERTWPGKLDEEPEPSLFGPD